MNFENLNHRRQKYILAFEETNSRGETKVVMNTLNKFISFIAGHFVKKKEIDFTLFFNKIKDSSFGYIAQQWLLTSVFRLKLGF